MSSDFLKTVIEAEHQAQRKRRLVAFLVGSGVIVLSVVGIGALASRHQDSPQQAALTASSSSSPSTENTALASKQSSSSSTTQATQSSQASTTSVPTITPTTPAKTGVDKSAFVAAANTAISNYLYIADVLKFDSTMSDVTKTDRINQAEALERQAIRQVTDLRAQLVAANVTSGMYMNLTTLAESGAADVGVGVTFAGYWATDHTRTSDLGSGLDSVQKGANEFVQLSQGLASL